MNSRYFTGALLLVGVVKLLVAIYLPLGNDEVYYLLYARYPDYHYYDHPLLIGWLLKVFSLNFLVESVLFYRLFALVLSAITPFFYTGQSFYFLINYRHKLPYWFTSVRSTFQ